MITLGGLALQKTTKPDTSTLMLVMQMNTIGLSIIYAEFERAKWHYDHPGWRSKTSSDSLAFIQGTGLDICLETYGLMYDADHLREVFFSMVGDHERMP